MEYETEIVKLDDGRIWIRLTKTEKFGKHTNDNFTSTNNNSTT